MHPNPPVIPVSLFLLGLLPVTAFQVFRLFGGEGAEKYFLLIFLF